MSGCPPHEELFAYLVGTIAEDAAEVVLDHVCSCPACQVSLQTIDQTARVEGPVQFVAIEPIHATDVAKRA